MIKFFLRSAVLFLVLLLPHQANVEAFVSKPQVKTGLSISIIEREQPLCLSRGSSQNIKLSLQDDEKSYDDGISRGYPVGILVLLVNLWFFSIPVEFRRNHWCFEERCIQDRSAVLCYDCVTFSEWREGVLDYYRNGGGVQWDFSIDPNSPFLLNK